MKKWFTREKGTPKNTAKTPTTTILNQMNERRPLPQGATEFKEWSDRIISGALCPADPESQRFALADLLLHLGPQESHKEDAFFIHSLRKFAVNQVAIEMKNEIKKAHDTKKKIEDEARIAAEALTQVQSETPDPALKLV